MQMMCEPPLRHPKPYALPGIDRLLGRPQACVLGLDRARAMSCRSPIERAKRSTLLTGGTSPLPMKSSAVRRLSAPRRAGAASLLSADHITAASPKRGLLD
jgi:hypothetical protein